MSIFEHKIGATSIGRGFPCELLQWLIKESVWITSEQFLHLALNHCLNYLKPRVDSRGEYGDPSDPEARGRKHHAAFLHQNRA
jgi:hypothetical protein